MRKGWEGLGFLPSLIDWCDRLGRLSPNDPQQGSYLQWPWCREYPHNSYGQKYGTNVPPCIGSWNSHWYLVDIAILLVKTCENSTDTHRDPSISWTSRCKAFTMGSPSAMGTQRKCHLNLVDICHVYAMYIIMVLKKDYYSMSISYIHDYPCLFLLGNCQKRWFATGCLLFRAGDCWVHMLLYSDMDGLHRAVTHGVPSISPGEKCASDIPSHGFAIFPTHRIHGAAIYPRCSTYGIFTYIWVVFGVNVGKYSIHGVSGYGNIYHQYTPVMLAYIPAPWIRHGLWQPGKVTTSKNG